MSEELKQLIDAARHRPFPDAEREAQRRSFAYGNTNIENDRVTREMVDRLAEDLTRELQDR
jgi:Fic family protein